MDIRSLGCALGPDNRRTFVSGHAVYNGRPTRTNHGTDKACPWSRRGGQVLSVPLNVLLVRGQTLFVKVLSVVHPDEQRAHPCT
uniref:Uncharacterized protein n=1 Tax=Acrobeloides nanus TaxID=290746 RepID=A0A914C602_9BILA